MFVNSAYLFTFTIHVIKSNTKKVVNKSSNGEQHALLFHHYWFMKIYISCTLYVLA